MIHRRFAAALVTSLALLGSAAGAEFVRVAQGAQGAWCFEQSGRRFLSMGICHITPREASRDEQGRFYDGAKVRGGLEPWAASTVERMNSWGFNTAGAWCDNALYAKAGLHTRYVWLGAEVDGIKQRLVNVFSPGYAAKMDALCAEFVAPHKNDPRLIGWFLDNELPWYGEFGWPTDPHRSLLDQALALPASDPNRVEALRFLRETYQDFASFAAQWETSATTWETFAAGGTARAKTKRAEVVKHRWAGVVAEKFYSVCAAAVRKHDPNHLVLGSRFAGNAPGPVIACARHCDVVSVNHYAKDGQVDLAWWDRLYAMVQKPILLTEFSWRAMENRTGNRNTLGADVTVPTQRDRAERYAKFVPTLLARPYLLGAHWFQWADEPERGRGLDGEDSNYGLVDWQDQAYEELTAAAQKTNAALPAPDTRPGPLPTAADRDGLAWQGRNSVIPTLPAGKLTTPVELATVTPFISFDDKGGSRGAATREGDGWKIDYNSGHGWGLNAMWAPPAGQSLTGAKSIRFSFDAPAGAKFNVVFFEKEEAGGDGECWITDPIPTTGGKATLQIDLHEIERNPYAGNQKGNRQLDLASMREIGLYFHAKQGAGVVRVSSLVLSE